VRNAEGADEIDLRPQSLSTYFIAAAAGSKVLHVRVEFLSTEGEEIQFI
jgi:hypothetical protein